jgi:hypothetical protein
MTPKATNALDRVNLSLVDGAGAILDVDTMAASTSIQTKFDVPTSTIRIIVRELPLLTPGTSCEP